MDFLGPEGEIKFLKCIAISPPDILLSLRKYQIPTTNEDFEEYHEKN